MSEFEKTSGRNDQSSLVLGPLDSHRQTLSALLDNESDDLELRRLCKFLQESPENSDISKNESKAARTELLQQWRRFNVAQASIHGELNDDSGFSLSDSFAASVMSALDAEKNVGELVEGDASIEAASAAYAFRGGANTVTSSNSVATINASSWRASLSKFAIAAGVAAVFVVVLQPTQFDEGFDAPALPGAFISSDDSASQSDNSRVAPRSESAINTRDSANLASTSQIAEIDPVAQQRLREYIDTMTFDPVESQPGFEDFQNSPLFRLVNEFQDNQAGSAIRLDEQTQQ